MPFKQIMIKRTKRVRPIQCGYRKNGTLAAGFSKTLAHGNSMNQIRRENESEKSDEYGNKEGEQENRSHNGL